MDTGFGFGSEGATWVAVLSQNVEHDEPCSVRHVFLLRSASCDSGPFSHVRLSEHLIKSSIIFVSETHLRDFVVLCSAAAYE